MKIKIRYNNEFQKLEVDRDEMWVSLSLGNCEGLSEKEMETRIQDKFDEMFNRPEYNNWHRHDRHNTGTAAPKRLDGKKGFVQISDEESDEPVTNTIDLFPDNTDTEQREAQDDYDALCDLLRKHLKELFIRAINLYTVEKDAIIMCMEVLLAEMQDTSEATFEKANLQNELVAIADMVERCIADNARFVRNQDEYEKKYNELVDRYENVKARIAALDEQITRALAEKETTAMYIEKLRGLPDTVTEFNEDLWQGLLQYMTVYGKDDYGFTFADGTEIRL